MPGAPDSFSNLTLWVEADSLTANDGDVIDPWLEAGTITIGSADDLAGDGAFTPNVAGTYQTNELCSNSPTIQFDSSNRGYASTTRVGLAYGTSAPAIFNDLGQFSVAAIGRIASGTDTGAELQLIQTDVVWLRIHNFGDGTGEVRLRINQNDALQTSNFTWSYVIGDWFLIVVRWDGTTIRAKFNSETEQTALFSSPLQSTQLGAGAPIKVGFDSDPVDQVGQVVMVTAWAHYLSESELDLLTSYFVLKYPCIQVCVGSPSAISGLTLWVEAGTLNNIYNDGDPVSVWNEAGAISISGTDDLVAAAGEEPTWKESILCSSPVLQLPGGISSPRGLSTTTRKLYHSTDPTLSVFGSNGFTLFTLLRVATWNGSITFGISAGPVDVYMNYASTPANRVRLTLDNDLFFPYTIGDWVLVEAWYDGTLVHAKVNGGAEQSASQSNFSSTTPGVFVFNDSASATGDLAEIAALIVYNNDIGATARAALRTGYLACRYPCLDFGGGADIRLRTTQFMRIGAGVGI